MAGADAMNVRGRMCVCPARVAWLAVAALIVLSAIGLGPAQGADNAPVIAALRKGNVYVSPVVFDTRVAAQVHNDELVLTKRGLKVKLVAIPPLAGQDISSYSSELRTSLGYGGTVVVTTPDGDVGAAGPRNTLAIQNALTAVGASQVEDPAARLLVAAEVSTPPPSDSSSGVRDLIILVGLALLGGAFAIGWGLRREQHRAHERTMESRAILAVYADALGARAAELTAHPGQTSEVRALVEAVDAHHVAAAALIDHATSTAELADAAAALRSGFAEAERAGRVLDVDMPAADPFANLCSVDPAHGLRRHHADDELLCAECADRLRAGHELVPRRVMVRGRPLSFREAPVPYDVNVPLETVLA